MALRALMKRKELTTAQKELEQARSKMEEIETREAELETAIEEAETEEEKATVEEAVEEFEGEKAKAEEALRSLEEKVGQIEKEIEDLERAQETPAPEEPAPIQNEEEKRGVEIMDKRNVFAKMDMQTREAIFEREDVKAFLGEVRSAMQNKRDITGGSLLIPEVFLGMIRENILEYSKLYKHVNVRQISGNGREVVMGTIPEAVWTECCANVNELSLTFNDAEVGCWAVAGYFAICRSLVDDNDVNLASEIVDVLGAAIGYALDKAIVYGTGDRMPQGIVPRLAQTSQPAGYSPTARAWADLHTSNITKTNATGVQLFQAIVNASAAAKGKYSRGEMVWVMNEKTYTKLKAEGLSVNAAGMIVSGLEGTMPVAGGIVEVLDFIPDYDIVFGYMDLYLLAERQDITIEESDHALFLARKRAYMGVARYDGLPVIAEGFAAINVNNQNVTTSVQFAADTANAADSE